MQVQTRVDVFEDIFLVFLGLGTLVGVVVVAYTLYNAYKYRDDGEPADDEELPTLGELPTGGKGGKKLFLSFGISAIIVISLVVWTYGMLLYVEDGPDNNPEDAIEIDVEGFAFGWAYTYDNGIETNELVVPTDEPIWIEVTARDVWHTFGITDLRVKADAIPGEVDETWFMAEETGNHTAECFELCGFGHSGMTSDVTVMEPDDYEAWVDDQLTLTITLEDQDEQPVTEDFEVELEHEDNAEFDEDLSATLGPEDFENGTVEIGDFGQGGTYDIVVTSEQYDDVEDTISFTGPTDETFTLEDPDAADDEDADDGADEDEDEADDDNDDDESNDTDEEQTDGGDDE
ncbi:cytochrome c oxidase subunit II [Natrarchaeobaculum aegyptiacum]|uniref:Cytochrome c oxidase subunit II n=1 Tax=Natrarchaeobaculum aegyptiacum TaxID=745377 RepID=A0A2Z2HTM9_9EURY|nr:cytochrome c oxidase subunit II [Natrarchaeobaculum aegyptiacum]ARS88424.1 cytochrome c oxidase subunit II [Natrarchaeobaculum aegyptiacum]